MADGVDFERYWLDNFAHCLDEVVGESIRITLP